MVRFGSPRFAHIRQRFSMVTSRSPRHTIQVEVSPRFCEVPSDLLGYLRFLKGSLRFSIIRWSSQALALSPKTSQVVQGSLALTKVR